MGREEGDRARSVSFLSPRKTASFAPCFLRGRRAAEPNSAERRPRPQPKGGHGSRMAEQPAPRTLWQRCLLCKPAEHVVGAAERGLRRHLTLWDLLCIGVGGSVGSGVFVLTAVVAKEGAGPSAALAWLAAGLAAGLSSLSFAELASRYPATGGSYAYAYAALGEVFAFMAGWCLFLEYGVSTAAVARAWGDKLASWLGADLALPVPSALGSAGGVNVFAGALQLLCSAVLLLGVSEGQLLANGLTLGKALVILFMVCAGLFFTRPANLVPFAPGGGGGVLRAAMKASFGYIGWDEICMMAGEAKDAKRALPLAVGGTIATCTVLYVLATVALVGMQRYTDLDTGAGFSAAFRAAGSPFAAQVVSVGELVTLPVVVLLGCVGQPRLQYAMAVDGLLPAGLAARDRRGNLAVGIGVSAAVMTTIALFVPFDLLDDVCAAGVLCAFNITNASLLALRHGRVHRVRAGRLIAALNGLSLAAGCAVAFAMRVDSHSLAAALTAAALAASALAAAVALHRSCPEPPARPEHEAAEEVGFRMPLVPLLPALATLGNWALLAQLQSASLALFVGYIALALIVYVGYSAGRSVGNTTGWAKDESAEPLV